MSALAITHKDFANSAKAAFNGKQSTPELLAHAMNMNDM